jgi:hypothetical protein
MPRHARSVVTNAIDFRVAKSLRLLIRVSGRSAEWKIEFAIPLL